MQKSTLAYIDVNAWPKYYQLADPVYVIYVCSWKKNLTRWFTQMLNATVAPFEAKLWMQRALVLHYKLRSDTFQNSMVHEIELA